MKEGNEFYVVACLSVLFIINLPVFVPSKRYPTAAEVRKLSATLPESITSLESVGISARRTIAEIETLNFFVRYWSQVNPDIATFLGERTTWGTVMSIVFHENGQVAWRGSPPTNNITAFTS